MYAKNVGCFKKAIFAFPVLMTFGIIIGIYYMFISWVILAEEIQGAQIFGLVIMNTFLFLGIWAYIQTIFTNPGFVKNFDLELIPEEEKIVSNEQMNEDDKKSCKVTVCDKCQSHRPPRAHHCSTCEECTLRFDHHCPWVANCVGLYNIRYFIEFLFYLGLASGVVAIMSLAVYVEDFANLLPLVSVIASGTIFLTLTGFSGVEFSMISSNSNTFENLHNKNNVFDTGSKVQNIKQVFGREVWKWFLPVKTDMIDGYKYSLTIRMIGDEPISLNKFIIDVEEYFEKINEVFGEFEGVKINDD